MCCTLSTINIHIKLWHKFFNWEISWQSRLPWWDRCGKWKAANTPEIFNVKVMDGYGMFLKSILNGSGNKLGRLVREMLNSALSAKHNCLYSLLNTYYVCGLKTLLVLLIQVHKKLSHQHILSFAINKRNYVNMC